MINAIADLFQNIFSPIVTIMGQVLLYFHTTLGAAWWLSIAMLTIVVRTLLFPLTVKQVKNMRAMQDLKPEMDRIRAQYRDNRQKQQEETMKLYQERKVNPLEGCLPSIPVSGTAGSSGFRISPIWTRTTSCRSSQPLPCWRPPRSPRRTLTHSSAGLCACSPSASRYSSTASPPACSSTGSPPT